MPSNFDAETGTTATDLAVFLVKVLLQSKKWYNGSETNSLTMSKPLASRSMFCKHCYESGRPNRDTIYGVFGSSSQKVHLDVQKRKTTKGFTPHFVFIKSKTQHHVEIHAICGVHGCGINIKQHETEEGRKYSFTYVKERFKTLILPMKDYLAFIVKWKDTGLEI